MTPRDQRFSQTAQQQLPPASADPIGVPDKVVINDDPGHIGFFSAFCENPQNVSFDTQEPDEHILLFLRKSFWLNFPWIVMTFILLILPSIVYLLRGNLIGFLPPFRAIVLGLMFYYILIAIYAFINFITWYYNAALITDKRVVDIDFHQLVFKNIAETKLSLVQDVSYNQIGVLPNILGYGYVLIQTAGTLDNFEFYGLPQPARVVEIVEDLIGGAKSS